MNDQHDLTVILRSRFPIVDMEAPAHDTQLAVAHIRDEIARTRPLHRRASMQCENGRRIVRSWRTDSLLTER